MSAAVQSVQLVQVLLTPPHARVRKVVKRGTSCTSALINAPRDACAHRFVAIAVGARRFGPAHARSRGACAPAHVPIPRAVDQLGRIAAQLCRPRARRDPLTTDQGNAVEPASHARDSGSLGAARGAVR